MRIAIPVENDTLSTHFGHCQSFSLSDVDPETQGIVREERLPAPPHEPGLLPRWLAERGATHIIAGGMGQRALDLFASHGIQVITGAPQETPQLLVQRFLSGDLATTGNLCDH